ncbi:hypothetical protein FEP57_05930 [Burkholderia multivorans]|nr:hypothetical protein [Burkholderia multivorans]
MRNTAADQVTHQDRHERDRQTCCRRDRVGLRERQRREQLALLAFQREHRNERQRDDEKREEQCRPDLSCRSCDEFPALRGGHPCLGERMLERFQVLVRVLDHHDGRIDHRADRDRDTTERHQVRVDALIPHHDERGQHAERQRQNGDERAAQVKQEHRTDEPNDDELLDELVLQVVHRAFDELRAVVSRDDFDAGRQRALQVGELRLHRVNGLQRIFSRAHHDDAAGDFALTVQLRDAATHLGADLDACDVAQQHRRARVVGAQYDIPEVVERAQIARRAHHVLRFGQLDDRAAGCLVCLAERIGHRGLRDAVSAQLVRVEHDLVLAHHAADAGDLGDVRHCFQLELQEPVVQRAQLSEVVLSGLVDQRVLVHPSHAGRVRPERDGRALRQAALHLIQVFEHARTCPVLVGLVVEQHVDKRIAERRVRANGLCARHAEQRRRERVGDLVLDNLRRLARIRCLDDDLCIGQVGQCVERRLGDRVEAPTGHEYSREQHQETVVDGPSDEPGNHCTPPTGSTFVNW